MERVRVWVHPGEAVKTPLRALEAGRASVLEFEICGAPEGVQSVQFHAGRIGRDDFAVVSAAPLPDNRWLVYASGLNFQDVGRTTYHLSAIDARGNSVWLGKGRLEIVQSVLSIDEEDIPVIPEDTYVRNPVTGKWHKLTCTVEDGVIVPSIDPEGVTR